MSGASGAAGREPPDEAPARSLSRLADVMIPGDEHYPRASETTAVEFLLRHLPEEDLLAWTGLLRVAPTGTQELAAWLRQVEHEQSDRFALLRNHLYYGSSSS